MTLYDPTAMACACSSADCLRNGCRLQRERQVWSTPPRGCICPPGANKDCESPSCPRKPLPLPSATMRTEAER